MIEVSLTYPTPEGSQEIRIDGGKFSFGRGSEVEQRFADDGLSRLHATVYNEGGRIWIVDENSSNGTFVNGERVQGGGTPLRHGDSIKIGHQTTLKVRIVETPVERPVQRTAAAGAVTAASGGTSSMSMLPVAIIAATIFIVSVSAVLIGFSVFGSSKTQVVQNRDDFDKDPDI